MTYRLVRLVRWHQADAYLRLGWLPTDVLAGTIHEQYSVMMAWLCECKAPLPTV